MKWWKTNRSRRKAWSLSLAELRAEDVSRAGAKAVTLGRMLRAGLPVPPGFVLTVRAFQCFLDSAPGWPGLQGRLGNLGEMKGSEVEAWSHASQKALGDCPVPPDVEQALAKGLANFPEVTHWAVRSSATAEDMPGASFAGQYCSFLNITRQNISEKVRQCWLSIFSSRAMLYCLHQGIAQERLAMAVVIQQMVPAELAGVMFTADPVANDRNRLVIESAPGLGEQVVSGRVTPVRRVLARASLAVLEQLPGTSTNAPAAAAAGTLSAANPNRHSGIRALDEALARRLAELAGRVEQLISGPLDMEWAVAGGEIFLLQARPITGQHKPKSWEDRQVWSNINAGEVAPDVMTPSTWSMICLFLEQICRKIFRMFAVTAPCKSLIGLVAGRIYFNANAGWAAMRPFRFVLKRVENLAQALGGKQIALNEQGLFILPDEDLPNFAFSWPKYILSWPLIVWDVITHSPRRGDAWIPRLKVRNDELTRLNFAGMSLPQLLEHFQRLMRGGFRDFDLLYLVTQAYCLLWFQKACRNWLDDPHLILAYRLFAGLGGIPETEAALALWRLALLAHAHDETKRVLCSAAEWAFVRAQLELTAPGRAFLAAWDKFMAEHGHHCRGELELGNARWAETPEYIRGLVCGYIRTIGQSDPVEKQRRLALEREQLTEQCRQRLRNPIKRWIFSRSLNRAQKLASNRETWKNEGVREINLWRRLLLEIGKLLHAKKVLAEQDDIFFLEINEIEPVANGHGEFDVQALVRRRRQEYQKNLALKPPPVVFGRFVPYSSPESSLEHNGKAWKGIPVYPGVVTGRARVILRTDDHEHVLPGEILVAPFTDPAWTPYFLNAAAVVMDQGGILSHGSIVAREYGLPAVTNVGSATEGIRTGDLVQVDGNTGHVTLLEGAPRAALTGG